MIRTFAQICAAKFRWAGRIISLSRYDLQKQTRDTKLGTLWLLIKPAIYIFCFWFALEVGLRTSRSIAGDTPFMLWLMSGMLPWFFLGAVMTQGSDVFHSRSFLVKKIKFPLCIIPTIKCTSNFFINLIWQVVLVGVYFAWGQQPDIHLVQVPFILIVMFLFWDCTSLLFSIISAFSHDFKKLLGALFTPVFWTSGIIFDPSNITIDWVRQAFMFNPFTFFIQAFRDTYCNHTWVWERPDYLIGFGIICLIILVATLISYKRLHSEVVDVL